MESQDILQLYWTGNNTLPKQWSNILTATLHNPMNFIKFFTFKTSKLHPSEFFLNYLGILHDVQDSSLQSCLEGIRSNPYEFMASCKIALHRLLLSSSPLNTPICHVNVRLAHYPKTDTITTLRSAKIGKLVSFHGTLSKISHLKSYATSLNFQCIRCKRICTVELSEFKCRFPKECVNLECDNDRCFIPIKESGKYVRYQRIRVSEYLRNTANCIEVDCVLIDYDVSEFKIGDTVHVTGVLKANETSKQKGNRLFEFYIDVLGISKALPLNEDEDISDENLQKIHSLTASPYIFHTLVHSMSPNIYGHEPVKAGLLLSLLNGSEDGNRNTCHVLLLGDPGTGKTQLLRNACELSAKGKYISGANKSLLTVQFTREGADNTIKAGALVMTDGGHCGIDELTGLGKEQNTLLEAMEQMTITVAKGSFYCFMPAKTTILAASNMNSSQFKPGKTLFENIKIDQALLSRFDLVFLCTESHDKEVSRYVLQNMSGRKRSFTEAFSDIFKESNSKIRIEQNFGSLLVSQKLQADIPYEDESYSQYLKRVSKQVKSLLPQELLKIYINYANKYIHPKLSHDAIHLLEAFYKSLRKDSASSLPITTRQMNGLKRLCEARAKAELRDTATYSDALEIIKLYQETVFDSDTQKFILPRCVKSKIGDRPLGELSISKQQQAFIEKLQEMASKKSSTVFSFQELVSVSQMLFLRVGDFSTFIEKLNYAGILLKQSGEMYKLLY